MYTLYTVKDTKSQIMGFWRDDKGKLYVNNIQPVKYSRRRELKEGIQKLFDRGRQAVFYTESIKGKEVGKGVCIGKEGKKTVYHNKLLLKRSRLSGQEVRRLLLKHGGLTIYNYKRSKGFYLIEVYLL